MLDRIYCIALRDSERIVELEREIARRGLALKFQRFSAIDTRNDGWRAYADELSASARAELEASLKRGHRTRNAQLTPGAIGCYLSHLGIYHAALARGDDVILVLEDDARLCDGFRSALRAQLEQLPDDWDMFVLNYERVRSQKGENTRAQGGAVRLRKFYGAYAYVVRARGMRRILERAWPICVQYDSGLSAWSGELCIYGASPPLASHAWQGTTVQSLPIGGTRALGKK